MLKTEKLVLAHFVEVDENRWRVFQSTLVHACLHLFSMFKKKKVFCIFSHNDSKRKGSVNYVIMLILSTLARPLKTLTLISSGWTVTAYNRIYIDLGLWCFYWCWLDNFEFFSGGVVQCSLSFPMLVMNGWNTMAFILHGGCRVTMIFAQLA